MGIYMKNRTKLMALSVIMLIGAFTLSNVELHATGEEDGLPASGVGVALDDGEAIEEMYETADNGEADYSMTLSADSSSVDGLYQGVSYNDSVSANVVLAVENIGTAQLAAGPIGVGADMANAINNEMVAQAEEQAVKDPENFSNLVIAQVTNYVNVRDIPSESGEVVGKLYDDSVGEFLDEENGWYLIKSGNVTGYVKAEYCVTGEAAIELAKSVGTRMAKVNTTTLKVRTEASTDAQVLGLVPIDEDLSVLEETEGWVKVSIEEGEGYVSSEYVDLRTDFVKAESKAEEEARLAKEREAQEAAQAAAQAAAAQNNTNSNSGGSSTSYQAPTFTGDSMGSSVAQYACQFVGNPYVYGGSSLTNGTDCSGFVMSVYAAYGVSLPHSSTADRSQGYEVEGGMANAQPGDIICYSGHVGIYIGNGQIVHASTSKTGIIIGNASYRNVLAVRRIF